MKIDDSTPSADSDSSPYANSRVRRLVRVGAWNGLTVLIGAALVGIVVEAYFHLTKPFMTSSLPSEFVPEVGLVRTPNAEMRYTNRLDFWTVQRSNSLGFLDREPPSLQRAAASCHVVVLGDSNVEAREVPLDAKLHMRLEEVAAKKLPRLKITTSAYGRGDTGQVQQLAFYDNFARALRPRLVVLVFIPNDFMDNSPVLYGSMTGWDPEHLPARSVVKNEEERMTFRPPQGDYADFASTSPMSWRRLLSRAAHEGSWIASWLEVRVGPSRTKRDPQLRRLGDLRPLFAQDDPPPVVQEALEYTIFALEQFKSRTDEDGARLVMLVSHRVTVVSPALFRRVSQIAADVGIPVIDQADYILRQGADLKDAQWTHDAHWNVAGHQWAAEALVEYIEGRPDLCDNPV